jgi:predicted MFS family arabinose efflux permease
MSAEARGMEAVRRKRGFFGWFFLLLFIGFNILMLWAADFGMGAADKLPSLSNNVFSLGVDLGAAIGIVAFIVCWVVGFLLLGLLAYLTRGRKVTEPAR